MRAGASDGMFLMLVDALTVNKAGSEGRRHRLVLLDFPELATTALGTVIFIFLVGDNEG
jgi:hypothetical protein